MDSKLNRQKQNARARETPSNPKIAAAVTSPLDSVQFSQGMLSTRVLFCVSCGLKSHKGSKQTRPRASRPSGISSIRRPFQILSESTVYIWKRLFETNASMSLQYKVDPFGSISIDSKSLPNDEIQFGKQLERMLMEIMASIGVGDDFLTVFAFLVAAESIREWRDAGRKGVWLNIPIDKSFLVPVAAEVCTMLFPMRRFGAPVRLCLRPLIPFLFALFLARI